MGLASRRGSKEDRGSNLGVQAEIFNARSRELRVAHVDYFRGRS
jgi:hypothetical protein